MAVAKEDKTGGYEVDFITKPDDSLYCPICLLVARDARQHEKCGKLFCNICLEKYQRTKKDCPCCKRANARFFEDNRSIQQIKSLQVRCVNQQSGCSWEGELRSSAKHARDKCDYRQVKCPLKCGLLIKWIVLAHHQEEDCKNRPYVCPECQQEGEYWFMTTEHLEDCPMVLTKCPNPDCDVEICAALMCHHIETDCEFTPVECKYRNGGCKVILSRKDIEEHENNDKYHLKVLSGLLAAQQVKLNDKEHQLQVLTGSLAALQTKYDELASVPVALQTRSGVAILKIHNFQNSHLDNGSKIVQFEACPGTYVIMATVHYMRRVKKDQIPATLGLNLVFSLIEGKNDDQLQWPFIGTIKVELLNQLKDKNHCTQIIHLPELQLGYKLNSRSCTGYYPFITTNELQYFKYRYWPNNTLNFRFTVTSDCIKPWLY